MLRRDAPGQPCRRGWDAAALLHPVLLLLRVSGIPTSGIPTSDIPHPSALRPAGTSLPLGPCAGAGGGEGLLGTRGPLPTVPLLLLDPFASSLQGVVFFSAVRCWLFFLFSFFFFPCFYGLPPLGDLRTRDKCACAGRECGAAPGTSVPK